MSTTEVSSTPLKPPRETIGVVGWLRRNLFNNWWNTLITVFLVWVITSLLFQVLRWVFTEATWTPVVVNLRLLMVGRYPVEQIWRVQFCASLILVLFGLSAGISGGIVRGIAAGLAGAFVLLALLPFGLDVRLWLVGTALLTGAGYLIGRRRPGALRRPVNALWIASPFVIVLLVHGFSNAGALPTVDTGLWGGLLLTILLAVVSIVASFPLGVLLALGRRSSLPVVRIFCTVYIEVVRGVPLITVLFFGFLLLPLVLPAGIRIETVVRAMVALTLFSAAYLAENVRGGLQSIPRGQVEAARALGLNVFQTNWLIILPQALRAVIPALVGQFISLFKDTSLVAIGGLAELLGIAGVIINQPDWLTVPGGVEREVLLFVALIYAIFCFSIAQISRRVEQDLGVGTR
jgi:general L-amino acid transport system permease protein